MKRNLFFLAVLLIIAAIYFLINRPSNQDDTFQNMNPAEEYHSTINPSDFISKVDNKYFTLTAGAKFMYEKNTDEGVERIEVVVTSETKKVMGVATVVVWDRVWLDGEPVEDTKDWYAQNKNGDVWYFGEEVDNYENGVLKDHSGAWEAGIDGALPGIIMRAQPRVGETYRQEYYKGKAEDAAEVIALGIGVATPYGNFSDCIKTRDFSYIEPSANEYKYYCPEIGFVVLEEKTGSEEKLELIETN